MTPEEIAAEKAHRNKLLRWLMLAVAVWGSLLALGALLFGIDDTGTVRFNVRPARGAIAICCVVGFLGVWAITDVWGKFRVWRRNRRIAEAKSAESKLAEADAKDKQLESPAEPNS